MSSVTLGMVLRTHVDTAENVLNTCTDLLRVSRVDMPCRIAKVEVAQREGFI